MGQKIHPVGFRLAVNKDWSSKWFAKSTEFATVLKQLVQGILLYILLQDLSQYS